MISSRQKQAHLLACCSLITLILLCISWEMWIAPLHAGGSWIALKFLPLLFPLRGVLVKNNYTMQWTSMLIWLYFTEGVVRAYSDTGTLSARLAWLEIALSLSYFLWIMIYLRPLKQAAKARKKQYVEN
ncbi:DUF2069 domain-containing protein [Undibacterium oligocarboniphilum]|uniref:DUF2069 domain-containing protein n=1 Tax=Undibacterium oligocarboniphilum TaxID=666702 RepID=A0A850QEU0_9BURK|nr:DUF2069 domain-containing protein [Undibacterium oligocarboniphilum]MBC3870100.1 DUF2069 domain-containing protein [Undibacterium oligocarboniphilum]NVO78091.1 DUF2069 domain-containing protein [Undibacterium oligocarboniphilum]